MTHHLDLDTLTLTLQRGNHSGPDDGMCLLEAAAYFAGEPWSDHPQCVSPVIGAFGRRFNDDLDDEGRQQLKPYIPRMVGTNTGPEDDERRAWMAAEWLVHVSLPTWLDAAGMAEQAAQVRALPKVDGRAEWLAARKTLNGMWDVAWARRREVFEPLRERVRVAVKEAVAAKLGAVEAAGAVGAVEAAAAVAAVEAVAAVGAVEAVEAVRWRVYDAVRDAVRPIFRKAIDDHPTVGPLTASMRQSGFELLDQMIAVGQEVPA